VFGPRADSGSTVGELRNSTNRRLEVKIATLDSLAAKCGFAATIGLSLGEGQMVRGWR
jgi:hypothetical protein